MKKSDDNKLNIYKKYLSNLNPLNWDISDFLLLIINLSIFIWAIIKNEKVSLIFSIYLVESFFIAFFLVIKIILQKSPELNNKNTIKRKLKTIFTFLFAYGFIVLIIIVFFGTKISISDLPLFTIIVLFLYHLFSFFYYFKKYSYNVMDTSKTLSKAIERISPLILIVTFWPLSGLIFSSNLVLLIVIGTLKILGDIQVHRREHNSPIFKK